MVTPDEKSSQSKVNKESFNTLIDLFNSVDVHEKGIEIVFAYLLHNKSIDDPKSISKELQLPLKRIYKIFSVLKDLGLIQVYDRPMKAILNPPVEAWEIIISNRMKFLQNEFNEKVQNCEEAFDQMAMAYNLRGEEEMLPPIEFLSLVKDEDPFEFTLNQLLAKKVVHIAKGVKIKNPHLKTMRSLVDDEEKLKKFGYNDFSDLMEKWYEKFTNLEFYVLFSEEYLNETLETINTLTLDHPVFQLVKTLKWKNQRIVVHISPRAFSSFVIQDRKNLLQFSIDPTNTFHGIFISRQQETTQVFLDKFSEMTNSAEPLNEYLTKNKIPKIDLLTLILLVLF